MVRAGRAMAREFCTSTGGDIAASERVGRLGLTGLLARAVAAQRQSWSRQPGRSDRRLENCLVAFAASLRTPVHFLRDSHMPHSLVRAMPTLAASAAFVFGLFTPYAAIAS